MNLVLLTLLVFLGILSILVVIHELGHFIAAKKFGIKVEEFGFGLPPRIFGIKRGETVYSLNWLPIGGFVKLLGEDRDSEGGSLVKKGEAKRAFFAKPLSQRAVVLVAGVAMNFFLAVCVISFLFTQGVMVPTDRVHIEKVIAGAPAEVAGLKEKDVIRKITIDNQQLPIKSGDQLIKTTREHLGEELILLVERDGQELTVHITPRKEYPQTEGPLGIIISNYEEKKYPIYQAPIYGMKESLILTYELAKGIGGTLWKLVTLQPVGKDVAGPIGIAQLTGQAIKFGGMSVLELLGILSLNLAIVNILPFPALDGGRLLFVVIEATTGRRLRAQWERTLHQVGMLILLTLIVLVTLNDLVRIFGK